MRASSTGDVLNCCAGSKGPSTANVGVTRRTSQKNLDRLFLGVAEQFLQATFLAYAGVLVAPIGGSLEVIADAVDPDHAGLHPARSLERALDVARPDRRGEPVLD